MMICRKNITLIILIFYLPILISSPVLGCKNILACGDSTGGDYNLLLKVRDPSRSGLQVLCIVPQDYEYEFYHPWTGEKIFFKVENKYFGITSKDDVIPNIVKAGMTLSDKGLAFGDADTNSNWINPSRYAWDDFDWIRYSCEKADNIDQAVLLLTEDVVNKYHAPGVSENLFVIGPDSGYIIEADAFNYKIKEFVNGVGVMSNYPKELWKSQILKTLPISISYDINITDYFKVGDTIRLNSLYGIKIINITESSILARQIPIFKINFWTFLFIGEKIEIEIGERKNVGDFSLKVLDVEIDKVKVELTNKFKAWENKMLENINSKYGNITVKDMFNWSRLQSVDLDGLRGMCEGIYEDEAVAIYKIPKNYYKSLSMGWFSPSFACSSIFVPFHISDNDIFDPYENGEAAQLCQNLFKIYGYNNLSCFNNIENVFLYENEIIENIAVNIIEEEEILSDFLTIFDINAQKQAYLTEKIWFDIDNLINQNEKELCINIIENNWGLSYSNSLINMKYTVLNLLELNNTFPIINNIIEIAFSVCKSRFDLADILGIISEEGAQEYFFAEEYINNFEYEIGFNHLIKAYLIVENLITE
jgi:hypothetical protein